MGAVVGVDGNLSTSEEALVHYQNTYSIVTIETFVPSAPLNQFIGFFLFYEGLNPPHDVDRFLPDGNTELLIDLADEPKFIFDNDTLKPIQTVKKVWVSGIRTAPITIPSGRGFRMFLIHFNPGMALPFYRIPLYEIKDLVVEADLVFGPDILRLRNLLLHAPTVRDMFYVASQFMLDWGKAGLNPDPAFQCIQYAVQQMTLQAEQISLNELVGRIGYSSKHFIHLFKKQVGVTPKEYLKIMRFQKVVLELEQQTNLPHWTHLALDCGYYDQAHFIHDFKQFSGFTPEEYLNRKKDLLNYVPVG